MNRLYITKKNWVRGVDSYGDSNPVHRMKFVADGLELKSAIAPGLWVASHVQHFGNPSSIQQIKFPNCVHDGDELRLFKSKNLRGRGQDYVFIRNEEVVCDMKGVQFGEYSSAPEIFSEDKVIHSYSHFALNPYSFKNFTRSLGMKTSMEFPNSYALSLSAPSLLSMREKRGVAGIHASQEFSVHRDFRVGHPMEVLIANERVRKGKERDMYYFSQQWVQDGEVKASGRALVLPLGSL